MASKAKNITICIIRGLVFLFRASYRLASSRPFVLSLVFFWFVLYRYFPAMFAFLFSSSPIIVCTALLLGTLLIYGEPETTNTGGEDRKIQSNSNNAVVKKDENIASEALLESGSMIKEMTIKEAGKGQSLAGHMTVRDVPDDVSNASSSVEEVNAEVHIEKKKLNIEREVASQVFVKTKEVSVAKQLEEALELREEGETQKSAMENDVGSLGSLWQPIDVHDSSSGSGSDQAESSSPDASVADIIPMLDELHPLLDEEASQFALRSIDNSDASSSRSSQDHESDDCSIEEETENQEEEEQEKDDANEAVVKWTADDQKNLMDLGTSELERNRRLENLIAKRRARKFLSFNAEKNLIDLEGYDPVPNVEDLSRYHLPSISAPRRNPFDIPFGSEENMDLPPIPGSAPSVLQPRHNPFDLPCNEMEEGGNLIQVARETLNHQEFVPVQQRDISYQRHENFTLGASFSGDFKQDKDDSKMKPYFIPQEDPEGTSSADFQRQTSENSDSDTTSSVMDPEDQEELVEQEFHQESDLLASASHYDEPIVRGSQSSEEPDSVDVDHEQIGTDEFGVGDDRAVILNASVVTEETQQASVDFGAVEMEMRHDDLDSPDSDTGKLEVFEERHDDSSSSSSEVYEKSSKEGIYEESAKPEQTRGGFLNNPTDFPADFNLVSNMIEGADDSQVADPVYDSSPSAVEKSLSDISEFGENLFYADKEGSGASNSLASDMQADFSEVGPPPRPTEKIINSEERGFVSVSGNLGEKLSSAAESIWVAAPRLSSVDSNESRSTEISETREKDVILAGLSGIHEGFSHPDVLILPESTHPPFCSSVNTDSSKGNAVEDVMISPKAPQVSRQASRIRRLSISDLPAIPEENSEDARFEEHDIASGVSPRIQIHADGCTGLHLIEPKQGWIGVEASERRLHPEANKLQSVEASGLISEKADAR